MEYVALCDFRDTQDERRLYRKGEQYPREGLNVSDQRLNGLLGTNNKAGFPLIAAVKPEIKAEKADAPENAQKQAEKPVEAKTGEIPANPHKRRKTAGKAAKRA